MEKSPLFENLIGLPNETRNATISDFATIMGVDYQTLVNLLTCYHTAQLDCDKEMILDLSFSFCTATAPRILDAAGIRSVLVTDKSTMVLKVLHDFLSAGWKVSAETVSDAFDGIRPALRLSRD